MKSNRSFFRRIPNPLSPRVSLLLMGWLSLLVLGGTQPVRISRPSAELMRNMQLLSDLDAGNLRSARQRLSDDSIVRIFDILESHEFTTNKDVLYDEPGMRAAAKRWGHRPLPEGSVVLQMDYPTISNLIYSALGIVKDELNARGRSPRKDGQQKQEH